MIEHHIERVNGIDVSYYAAGEGEAIVMLHGMAETAWSCWSHQIEALSKHYRVYAVDQRAHGRTGSAGSDGTLEQLSADLNEFLRVVSGPAICIGFSMGGTIALHAAAQPNTLLKRVVSVGGSSIVGRTAAAFFHKKAETVNEHRVPELYAQIDREIEGMLVVQPELAPKYAKWRMAAVGEGYGYANAALAMARMREVPLQPELAKITVPVDVVGGENDAWCPKKASDVIIEGLTSCPVRYTEIPRVGHLMSVDDPEAVSSSLLTVLSTTPKGAIA